MKAVANNDEFAEYISLVLGRNMVAHGCHSKITNCLSIFIVYFSFLYINVLIDLIC